MKRILAAVAPLLIAVGLAACSSASGAQPATGSPSGAPASAAPGTATIVASNLAFQQSSVSVSADQAFSLTFVNQDQAPHNVAIFTDSSASTGVFAGDVITAGQTTYQVPVLKAGTYYFRCDVHPDMHGEIVAK